MQKGFFSNQELVDIAVADARGGKQVWSKGAAMRDGEAGLEQSVRDAAGRRFRTDGMSAEYRNRFNNHTVEREAT